MILITIGIAIVSFGIGFLIADIRSKKICAEKLEALRISFKTDNYVPDIEDLLEDKEKIRKEIEEVGKKKK